FVVGISGAGAPHREQCWKSWIYLHIAVVNHRLREEPSPNAEGWKAARNRRLRLAARVQEREHISCDFRAQPQNDIITLRQTNRECPTLELVWNRGRAAQSYRSGNAHRRTLEFGRSRH